jgi:hypothetical protein
VCHHEKFSSWCTPCWTHFALLSACCRLEARLCRKVAKFSLWLDLTPLATSFQGFLERYGLFLLSVRLLGCPKPLFLTISKRKGPLGTPLSLEVRRNRWSLRTLFSIRLALAKSCRYLSPLIWLWAFRGPKWGQIFSLSPCLLNQSSGRLELCCGVVLEFCSRRIQSVASRDWTREKLKIE